MCTGAAFYHTDHIGPLEALEIGCAFFESTGIRITSAGYYEYLENGIMKETMTSWKCP